MIDLFREWDTDGDGEVNKDEFRKAMPLLGLHVPRADVDALFDSFDADGGGTISFRELNKHLRRDVKAEKKEKKEVKVEVVELADIGALRAAAWEGMLGSAIGQMSADELRPRNVLDEARRLLEHPS